MKLESFIVQLLFNQLMSCNQAESYGSASGICMMKLDHFVLQTLQKTLHVQSLLFQGLKQLKNLNRPAEYVMLSTQ